MESKNKIIKGLGFTHLALKAADFNKSDRFYRALGMEQILTWGEGEKQVALYDFGDGGCLELFANGGDEYSDNGKYNHFALGVEDVDEAYSIALSAGAQPFKEPKTVPLDSRPFKVSIRIAFVLGPDGEQIEFFRMYRD